MRRGAEQNQAARQVAAIRDLAPLVEAHRSAMDHDRRMPEPVCAALAETGLLRLWLPRAFDGPELSPMDFMDVIEAAAALDGSLGWLVGNGGGMSRAAGYLPADVAGPWFAEPRAFVACSTGASGSATPVEGGFRVSGRWPFASGIHQATRVMGLCAVETGDPPPVVACYMAPADVTVIDTWFVSGLRGTGSCDFAVRDLFVPSSHTHPFPELTPTQPGLVYRLPLGITFPLSVGIVPLGLARAAIGHFVTLAQTRTRLGAGVPLAQREAAHLAVGRAEALYRGARAFVAENIAALETAADAGGATMIQARAGLRAALAHAADSAMQVVDILARTAGSAALFENLGLERCIRDLHAAVRHVALDQGNYMPAGRLRLGLDVEPVRS